MKAYKTSTTSRVLELFTAMHPQPLAGSDICKSTRIKSGTIYPMLARMRERGWAKSEWEKIDPKKEGRPRRKLYKLTTKGYQEGHKMLAENEERLTSQTKSSDTGLQPVTV